MLCSMLSQVAIAGCDQEARVRVRTVRRESCGDIYSTAIMVFLHVKVKHSFLCGRALRFAVTTVASAEN